MATREQNDLWFGHAGFVTEPTLEAINPWTDYDRCARCGHIRWNHAGAPGRYGSTACHTLKGEGRCDCSRFIEHG